MIDKYGSLGKKRRSEKDAKIFGPSNWKAELWLGKLCKCSEKVTRLSCQEAKTRDGPNS